MQFAYLILGSNIGDSKMQLQQACNYINAHCGIIVKKSSIYETAAWGKTDEPNFLNQAVMLQTTLPPQQLLQQILAIETTMGRVRSEKYASRVIDIDILFYGRQIINEPGLSIPHPHLANRKFVLIPLAELVPSKIHPILHKSVLQLLNECNDPLAVQKIA